MQKFKFLKSPFIVAAIICFVIAVSTAIFFSGSKTEDVKGITQKISPALTSTPIPTVEPTVSLKTQNYFSPSAAPTVTVQANSNNNQQNPTSTQTPQNTNTDTIKTFQVSLKINGSSVGSVDVQEGGNQCDVLSRAKDQGKISQLLMKYDNNLGTNGVYQINGVGKENSVWWVYKINGASPGQGCSYIKANSGDSVEWEYVGN